ncbi:hypothetical protein WA158_005216 [Blastocystis sp. Blastoise]
MGISDIEIICICPFLDVDNIKIHFSSRFNSFPLTDQELKQKIEDTWNDALEKNPRIWNQSKFRYHSVNYNENERRCILNLGFTDYKSFITTNNSDLHDNLFERGLSDWNDGDAYIGNPMGNQACICTSDHYMVLIQRSQFVSESKGRAAGPGGHPEPEYLSLKEAPKEEDASINNVIAIELYKSILKEIYEETSIPISSVYINKLIGFMRNKVTGGRQGMLFFCKTTLSKEQVLEEYRKGVQDQYESINLVFIPLMDILNKKLPVLLYSPESEAIFVCLQQLYMNNKQQTEAICL